MSESEHRSFWSEQCPERGMGLDHSHWKECDPERGHPPDPGFPFAGDVVHQWGQCCHCEHTADTWAELQADELPAAEGISIEDHQYQPTIVGLCNRCKRPLAAHAPEVRLVSFETPTCIHTNVSKVPLIGDGGLEWPACQNCGTGKEPHLATGVLTGPSWERGRVGNGWINPRMERVWGEIAYRHREYIADMNGSPV